MKGAYTPIPSDVMDKLCQLRINGESHQLLHVVARKTYGFNKASDFISTSQIIKLTGLHRQAVYRARKKLLKMNILTITRRGNEGVLCYSIQPSDQWRASPKKVPINQKGLRVSPKEVEGVTQEAPTIIDTTIVDTGRIDILSGRKKPDPNVRLFTDFFFQEFQRHLGNKPHWTAKDGALAKKIVQERGIEKAKELLVLFFNSKDPFIAKAGFTMGVFCTQLNKLLSQPNQSPLSKKNYHAETW